MEIGAIAHVVQFNYHGKRKGQQNNDYSGGVPTREQVKSGLGDSEEPKHQKPGNKGFSTK